MTKVVQIDSVLGAYILHIIDTIFRLIVVVANVAFERVVTFISLFLEKNNQAVRRFVPHVRENTSIVSPHYNARSLSSFGDVEERTCIERLRRREKDRPANNVSIEKQNHIAYDIYDG